jgi:predicted acylesterase/phospholipase RssA
MATAFVLSGGGSLGSIQVGMLLALAEAEITPDIIVGTSVGAMNGGWVASRPDAAGIGALADLWRSLTRSQVFPTSLTVGLLGFLGQRRNLVPDTGVRRLLEHHLGFQRLEESPAPRQMGTRRPTVPATRARVRSDLDEARNIVRSATAVNAELLMVPGLLGTIREGAFADLLVVDGDPLKDVRILCRPDENLLLVMKDGVIYSDRLTPVP